MSATRLPECPRAPFISWFEWPIWACSRQHRKLLESPRPLAVAVPKIGDFRAARNLRFLAKRHIRGSPHRPPRIGVGAATPLRRDWPSPFQSARTVTATAPRQHRTATAIPQSSPASAGAGRHRTARRAPASLARVARAPTAAAPTAGQPASDVRRRTAASDAPATTPGWGFLGVPSDVAGNDSRIYL